MESTEHAVSAKENLEQEKTLLKEKTAMNKTKKPPIAAAGHAARKQQGINTPNDTTYKVLFSHRQIVQSLLLELIGQDYCKMLDFSSMMRWPDTGISKNRREYRNDLIWRIRTRSGIWLYLFVIFEFQSTCDPWMAIRILHYVSVFYITLIRTGQVKKGDPLPPVLPIVIYNGKDQWTASFDIKSLMQEIPQSLLNLQPAQRYIFINVGKLEESFLPEGSLLRPIVKLEQADSLETICAGIHLALATYAGEEFAEIRDILTYWIQSVALKRSGIMDTHLPLVNNLKEVGSMLEENMKKWREMVYNEGKNEGINKGINEGINKGIIETLTDLNFTKEKIIHYLCKKHKYSTDQAEKIVIEYENSLKTA